MHSIVNETYARYLILPIWLHGESVDRLEYLPPSLAYVSYFFNQPPLIILTQILTLFHLTLRKHFNKKQHHDTF